jgi:uncharacterized protein YbjT (DUF2867 family)
VETRILVTGATGMLGRAVVRDFTADGLTVRATSRQPHRTQNGAEWVVADLATGDGVRAAVADVDAVLHLAAAPYKRSYTDAVEVGGTRRLLDAAREAGVGHIVYMSIVGTDTVPWGYFGTKFRAEQMLRSGAVPWSIVRATQFHEFVEQALRRVARLGVLVADRRITVQSVDVRDLAGWLRRRVAAGPSNTIEEVGGPEKLTSDEVVRRWLRARGVRRPVLPVRLPGTFGKAVRTGALTTDAEPAGRITWTDYLSERYPG